VTATKHETVAAALAAVMGELGGIEKLTPEERRRRGLSSGEKGVTYAYRGIDQIAAAAQPLLAKHGVILVPEVVDIQVEKITVNNNPWTDTMLTVRWTIAGPGEALHACTAGLGRDNSDKGVNKAMTGAFKNLLLRLLCIGDPDDDTDGHTHIADAAPVITAGSPSAVVFERLRQIVKGTPVAEELKRLAAQHGKKLLEPDLRDTAWRAVVEGVLDNAALASTLPAGPEPELPLAAAGGAENTEGQ
jgi:hypothetical protein